MKLKRSFFESWPLIATGFFVCLFFVWPGSSVSAAVINHNDETTEIAADSVWRAGEIHVFADDCSLVIDAGVTLTIEPGVIVKLGKNSAIMPIGNLTAVGLADKPIVFTSSRDDSSGGDTNGDASATSPAPGDWYAIMTPPPSAANINLSFVKIQYGGKVDEQDFVVLFVDHAQSFTVSSSSIINNSGYIIFGSSAPAGSKIVNSNIYNPDFPSDPGDGSQFYGTSMVNQGGFQIDLSGNYFGHSEGPTVSSGEEDIVFKGTMLSSGFDYLPFASSPLDLFKSPSVVVKRHPVILIPGILGSWPDQKSGKLVLDPITHNYDDLLKSLEAVGYAPEITLFTFPYEWRKSNIETAKLLKEKIDEVKNTCLPSTDMDCTKVDLIGHSMGGLVARQYIESGDYAGDVDQMIFIATPHKGAPFAYATWEGGYIGKTITDGILAFVMKIEASKKTGIFGDLGIVKYLQNFHIDSVKELLPTYSYLFDYIAGKVIPYPTGYPSNEFLSNLNSVSNLQKINQAVKITNIIGDTGNDTIVGFSVVSSTKSSPMWQNGMPHDFYGSKDGVIYGSGDGTVSASSNKNFGDDNDIVINKDHNLIVGYSQSAVIKELTGITGITEIHNNAIVPNVLMISMQCPADIQIVAPDGKRIGRDMYSSSTIYEIPGAYYYSPAATDTPEFAIIPNPQEGNYQVKVLGTETGGSYAVSLDYLSESSAVSSQYQGSILSGNQQILNFVFSAEATSTPIKSNISIQTTMTDVNTLYGRGLISGRVNRDKILLKYQLINIKVNAIDGAIKLAELALRELEKKMVIPKTTKIKLMTQVDKLKSERYSAINNGLSDINSQITALAKVNVLKSLGYDILKADNDYLLNNW